MFETNIGPGSSDPGYLRPETAQGIFVEFPRIKEYARNRLPFGVTQVGRAYRNEISPRKSIVRTREFTQAELEQFIDPEEDEPPLAEVEDVVLPLYAAAEQQTDDGGQRELTVREAVDEDIVESEWVAYYLGVSRSGTSDRRRHGPLPVPSASRGRTRTLLRDCWDAESEVDGDWIEIAGFSYRSDYDLSKHAEHSGEDYTVFKQYDEPITVDRATVDPDMSYLGPEFGGSAGAVADALEALAERNPDAFDDDEVTVEVDGKSHTVARDVTNFASKSRR